MPSVPVANKWIRLEKARHMAFFALTHMEKCCTMNPG